PASPGSWQNSKEKLTVARSKNSLTESSPESNGRGDEMFAFGANVPDEPSQEAILVQPNQEEPAVDDVPDPFDPARYRKSRGLDAASGVKKLLNVVPVRKPKKGEFVRVHSSPAYRMEALMLTDDAEGSRDDLYLVVPELEDELVGEPTACRKL